VGSPRSGLGREEQSNIDVTENIEDGKFRQKKGRRPFGVDNKGRTKLH